MSLKSSCLNQSNILVHSCRVNFMLNGVEVVSMGVESSPGPTSASNSVLLALNPRDEVIDMCKIGEVLLKSTFGTSS